MKVKLSIILSLLITLLCANQLQAQEKAFPKKGEGIALFLKRHNRTGADYQKQFIELNKSKLGKGNTLRMGVKYTLPPLQGKEAAVAAAKRANYEPLFGKELASYKVTSSELKGACFYLVSGHGGPDPGAIGRIGSVELHEDEYAYDIVLRLARNLMMKGAKVHIIIQDAKDGIRNDKYLSNSKRETCMGSPIPFNQVRRLQQRCDKINALFKQDKYAYKQSSYTWTAVTKATRRTCSSITRTRTPKVRTWPRPCGPPSRTNITNTSRDAGLPGQWTDATCMSCATRHRLPSLSNWVTSRTVSTSNGSS